MNRKLLPLLLFILSAVNAFAQSDSVLQRNIRALESYSATHPIEKVHLHLDRQLYFPGDTIWFEAYVVAGPEHKLSALSGILYAELISPKDSVIKRLTLGLQNGTAPGDFELPYDAPPGNYRIRAYTSWMRNFGPEYFFDQQVIVSGFSTPPALPAATTNGPAKMDLQFFPEGGDLVNGLRSKVAFKAVNPDGLAEEVQGSITDNQGNEAATFNSQHLGMGAFPLEPEAGKTYFAKVTAADGSHFSVPLPVAQPGGYTLTLNNSAGDSLYVKVAAKKVSDTVFYLLAQHDGRYDYAASGKVTDKPFTAAIPKSRFPTGIEQFTLFSQSGEPLNERIVFIQNDDQLHLTVTTDKQTYAPGEEVKVNIEAKDKDGKPAVGTFSVAVVDESKVPVNEQTENTMFTDLLLKSEISGYIQNPNYYFISPNEQTKADLDLLMLTQGYRRFEWKQIQKNDTTNLAYQPEKGFTISGMVTTPAGKPVAKGEVILTSVKNHLLMDTLTDNNGRFRFENIGLTDTATIIINSKKANGGGNVKTSLDKPSYPVVDESSPIKGYLPAHFNEQLPLTAAQIKLAYTVWQSDSLNHVIRLREVQVKSHKIPPFHPDYAKVLKYSANLNGPGNANQVIIADETFPRYASLAQALENKVLGVDIAADKGAPARAFSRRAIMRHLSGSLKPMAIYVNGTQANADVLSEINPADVYSVEVLTSAMYLNMYGADATNGALIITLKNGSQMMSEMEPAPGLLACKFFGFYKALEFYRPKFGSDLKGGKKNNPGLLTWKSQLATDQTGKAAASFFSVSDKQQVSIVLSGIDENGRIGYQVLHLNPMSKKPN